MKTASKTLTVKQIFNASTKKTGSESINLILADGTTFGVTAKIVSTLPTKGENGILYLVPKSDPESSNTYDEYLWVLEDDGTFGFEKIGSTDITVTLYDTTGTPTPHLMVCTAVTDVSGTTEYTWTTLI